MLSNIKGIHYFLLINYNQNKTIIIYYCYIINTHLDNCVSYIYIYIDR